MASTLSAKPLGARTEWATRAVFFIGGFGAVSRICQRRKDSQDP